MNPRFLSTTALLSATAALGLFAPMAQASPTFGVNGGLFFPSSSKTKDVFGSRFTSIGVGLGSVQVAQRKLYPDFGLIREDKGGNKATVVMVGGKLLSPFGRPRLVDNARGFAPYGGVGVNAIYADINAPSVGVNKTGLGVGASVIVGTSYGDHLYAEGSYRLATSAADFNFSGAQVAIGLRF